MAVMGVAYKEQGMTWRPADVSPSSSRTPHLLGMTRVGLLLGSQQRQAQRERDIEWNGIGSGINGKEERLLRESKKNNKCLEMLQVVMRC
jgi:hypothetical protein